MNRTPPSERPAQREAEAAKRTTPQEQAEALKRDMRITFSTPEGQNVLRWIRSQCQGGEPILGAMNGQIDEKATMYQAMRLNLWLSIRKLLTFNILKEVEYDDDQIS